MLREWAIAAIVIATAIAIGMSTGPIDPRPQLIPVPAPKCLQN